MTKSASDIMQTHVVTVGVNTPISNVRRLFFEEGIQAAPVVTEEGRVEGVITTTDLLRIESEEMASGSPMPAYAFSAPDRGDDMSQEDGWHERALASDVMSESLVTVEPMTDVREVVRVLHENRLHHILVTDSERLVGIISTFDLLDLFRSTAH